MDLAGLPDGPDTGSRAGRRSTAARRPGALLTRTGTARSERVCVTLATPAPGSGAGESSAAAAEAADRAQAEYFLVLLIQRRRVVDRHIDEHRKAAVAAEVGGDAERAYTYRRMLHDEEHDRRTLDGMIEKLHRRFPRQGPGNVPPGVQARFAAR